MLTCAAWASVSYCISTVEGVPCAAANVAFPVAHNVVLYASDRVPAMCSGGMYWTRSAL